jgi:GMP synthase (glutamine-hydrolysing)
MVRVRVIQHVDGEGPGLLAVALERAGVAFTVIRADRGEPVPTALDGATGLVLLGGPMSVHQAAEHPHLGDELRSIEAALHAGAPVLGVCLGSQLLAAALGARVHPGRAREIGWFAVTPKPAAATDPLFGPLPPSFVALHWHGDVFELPAGATSLASSEMTEHQAFRHGDRAYGILFHPEATLPVVRAMATGSAAELAGAGISAEALLDETERRAGDTAALGVPLFQRWAALVAAAHVERAVTG